MSHAHSKTYAALNVKGFNGRLLGRPAIFSAINSADPAAKVKPKVP
jgi:hypothetical protein